MTQKSKIERQQTDEAGKTGLLGIAVQSNVLGKTLYNNDAFGDDKFMQPIATDTILQQRYRLINLIGEGGFGRTYLATDQSRFSEQCAIKELALAAHSSSRLDKAKEFFQQEAALLYQLQHPQIPRFWATFEERDRLFLVQDFIPGHTYEDLLKERSDQQQTFTEAEVWRFLLQVLPVLGYIHSQGVIHQDISPDNIILRETDLLPVLIDFGVVKQLASRLQGDQTGVITTKVGKPGYAPLEQLRGGQAFPNSDLYSLAVTALVLLTGRAPTDLLQDGQVNWAWRNWVNISDGLAEVLGKMLSYQPMDRYQSSVEVFQALQSLSIPVDRVAPSQPTSISQLNGVVMPPDPNTRPNRSQAQTVAKRVYSVLTQFDVKSVWEQPRVFIPLFFVMAFVSFAAGLGAMTFWQNQTNPVPVATGRPSDDESMVNSSSPSSSAKAPHSIAIVAGETTMQTDRLAANQKIDYEFYGTQGQDITIAIDNKNLLLTVLGPNGIAVDPQSMRVSSWRGKIATTGKHLIQVKQLPGVPGEFFEYRLSVSLALPVATPSPSPSINSPSASPTEPITDQSVPPTTTNTTTDPLPSPKDIPRWPATRPSAVITAPEQNEDKPESFENKPFDEPLVPNNESLTTPLPANNDGRNKLPETDGNIKKNGGSPSSSPTTSPSL
jgi:serine/threonine protein kinase